MALRGLVAALLVCACTNTTEPIAVPAAGPAPARPLSPTPAQPIGFHRDVPILDGHATYLRLNAEVDDALAGHARELVIEVHNDFGYGCTCGEFMVGRDDGELTVLPVFAPGLEDPLRLEEGVGFRATRRLHGRFSSSKMSERAWRADRGETYTTTDEDLYDSGRADRPMPVFEVDDWCMVEDEIWPDDPEDEQQALDWKREVRAHHQRVRDLGLMCPP